jgi:hypothetical protein
MNVSLRKTDFIIEYVDNSQPINNSMKKLLILSIFCLFSFSSFAQITIEFSEYMQQRDCKWRINGATFKPSFKKIGITTNYPKMDTIF